jgi:hypothetical protein
MSDLARMVRPMVVAAIVERLVNVQPMPESAAQIFRIRYRHRICVRRRGKVMVYRSERRTRPQKAWRGKPSVLCQTARGAGKTSKLRQKVRNMGLRRRKVLHKLYGHLRVPPGFPFEEQQP